MAADYNYDENGAIFNFFLLTLISILLIPSSILYYRFYHSSASKIPSSRNCSCSACNSHKLPSTKKYSFIFLVLLAIGWLFFTIVAYSAATTKILEAPKWDPYEILGLDSSSSLTKAQIKKAFKTLSLKFHPDKVSEAEKEASQESFIRVSKAYKILTNEDAKSTFDETGDPDGVQSMKMGLALPKWLVEKDNNIFVLFIYGLIFGFALPFSVARWWYSAKELNNSKILNSTMGSFYRDLKDNSNFKYLVEIISKAQEFTSVITWSESDSADLDTITEQIKASLDKKTSEKFDRLKQFKEKDVNICIQEKVAILLHAHLARVTPNNPELAKEQEKIVIMSYNLVNGLLQIALSRFWLNMVLNSIELSQLIMQAIYFRQSPLFQLPYLDVENLKHFHTKKRQISSIKDFLQLDTEEQRNLVRTLNNDEFNILSNVSQRYPVIKIVKAHFTVIGETVIVPHSLVTLVVHFKIVDSSELKKENENTKSKVDSNEKDEIEEEPVPPKWWLDSAGKSPDVHAPYFPNIKKPIWWVMMADLKSNRLITITKVTDLVDEKKVYLKFQAPPDSGSWNFQVYIKSDCYVGCDVMTDVKLVVLPESAAPFEEFDDEISEPEEDSLAGQMQQMKKQKAVASKKKPAKKIVRHDAEDSSDSEDEAKANSRPHESDSNEDFVDNSEFIE